MAIKPEGTNPIIVPPDNIQSRWGDWEASLDTAGTQASEVFAETHAIATSSQSTAEAALAEAQSAIDDAALANSELGALLDPENENSELWLLQWQINESDREALERHQEAIAANAEAISAIQPNVTRTLWLDVGASSVENEFMRAYRGKSGSNDMVSWTIKPGWAGTFQVTAGTNIDSSAFNNGVYMRELTVPSPQFGSFNTGSIGAVLLTINVSPGTPKVTSLPIPNQTLSTRGWTTLQSWAVPQGTMVTAAAKLTWTNKTRVASYGLRIMVNGVNNTSSSASATAPLLGHGPRVHSAAMDARRVQAGSIISLQAKADHANSLNRHLSSATFGVTWVDNTVVAP